MDISKLNGANALSLPEAVYRSVRDAILNGVFAPGQMLRQEEVASRLGVSRSPLREALPRLEAEGIVVSHPRRGYAVASLDLDEIVEAFDLRALLETELARRSIADRTDADIARVYAVTDEMAKLADQADQADRAHWFELNTQLHNALLSPAGCKHYMRALDNTRGLIEAYIRTEVSLTGDLRQARQEHNQLAEAFVEGNAQHFVDLTRDHSIHTRDRLLGGLSGARGLALFSGVA
jgi:DNA-binding GntR family transcriptional regulator